MSAQTLNKQIDDIVNFINSKTKIKLHIGLILGSGLGNIADGIEIDVAIPYSEIPHIPASTAPGHAGRLIIGKLDGKNFITMQGRLHLYEGHTPQTATLLVRAMKKLGVNTLFITAAAGGLNYHFHTGEIMLITDHINFSGHTPLLGANLDDFGPRFCNMFDIYTENLQKVARKAAIDNRIQLCQGVYAGILGPQYATRAELQFLLQNNCDAIGMSVVQEAIVAAHSGMQILGLAAITDMALPYATHHASELEVVEQAKLVSDKVKTLITEVARSL
jgi:purine-nucleoside phosphorylase